ncbi:hypothetical protein K466DRAFT_656110 [Polyporus arcularius HHB13444]|uniref:Uncharacterized protein n=1 Tax=Polyporus arcularius HHB13444 TaxID=1314778 RepID=A0A5C3NXP5_9APHY|nr:hypothetical protein K466DRAFT_656110 [Polyporus arcularius HHB13444]
MVSSRDVATYLNVSGAAFANLSQTADATSDEVQLALWYEGYNLKDSMINVALLTMFFGLLTVLSAVAAYVLLSKQIERRRSALMLLAIVAMWTTTLAYWVANIVAVVEAYTVLRDLTTHLSNRMLGMQDCLAALAAAASAASGSCMQGDPLRVTIGDSIVWWRAWVLWPDNRVVRCSMLTFTSVLDTADVCLQVARQAAPGVGSFKLPTEGDQFIEGSMFAGSAYGLLAGLCCLLTNVAATSLIAYRAWEHRCIIMSYLRRSSRRTQVERTLALLVESGLLYCTLWMGVVVCDFIHAPPGHENSAFAHGFRYVMNGCLVPIIGMYPTLMIIVCAVDRSLYEKSADDLVRGFDEPSIRRCGTLSELLSASSAFVAAEGSGRVRSDKLIDASL